MLALYGDNTYRRYMPGYLVPDTHTRYYRKLPSPSGTEVYNNFLALEVLRCGCLWWVWQEEAGFSRLSTIKGCESTPLYLGYDFFFFFQPPCLVALTTTPEVSGTEHLGPCDMREIGSMTGSTIARALCRRAVTAVRAVWLEVGADKSENTINQANQ